MASYENYLDLTTLIPIEGTQHSMYKFYTLPVILEQDSETHAITYNLPLLEEFMESEYSFGASSTEGTIIDFDRDMFEDPAQEGLDIEEFKFERVKIGEELYWKRQDTGCLFKEDNSNITEEQADSGIVRGWLKHVAFQHPEQGLLWFGLPNHMIGAC